MSEHAFVAGLSARHDDAAIRLQRMFAEQPSGFAPADLIARIRQAFGGGGETGEAPRGYTPANRDAMPTKGWDPLDSDAEPTPFIDPAEDQPELTRLIEVDPDEPFVLHPGEFALGATFEQDMPEIARALVDAEPDRASTSDFVAVLAHTMLNAPSFSLRGGTREILRGIIARGLGVR